MTWPLPTCLGWRGFFACQLTCHSLGEFAKDVRLVPAQDMVLMLLFLGGRSGMRSGIVNGLLGLLRDALTVLLQDLSHQFANPAQV